MAFRLRLRGMTLAVMMIGLSIFSGCETAGGKPKVNPNSPGACGPGCQH